jgi:hypothetical protein
MPNRYWVGGTGDWSDATNHWSDQDGGTPNASFLPTASDDVFFNTNSHTTNYTVTVDTTTRVCRSFTATAPSSGNLTLAGTQALNISGSFSLYSGMIRTYTGAITFNATTSGHTINTAGVQLDSAITFAGVGGAWDFTNHFESLKAITITSGTVNTNGYNLTIFALSSSNSNVRAFNPFSSTIYITGNNATVINMFPTTNMTIPENTATIDLNYSGAVGTRIILNVSNQVTTKKMNLKISAGTDTLLQSTYFAKSVDFTGFSGTWSGNSTFVFEDDFTIAPTVNCTTNGLFQYEGTTGEIHNFISNGKTLNSTLFTIDYSPSGHLKIVGNLDTPSMVFDYGQGILDMSNITANIARLVTPVGTAKTLYLTNSTINFKSTGEIIFGNSNLVVDASGSTLIISNTSSTAKTFFAGNHVWNDIYVTGDNITFTSDGNFNNFYLNNAGMASGLIVTYGTTQTIRGSIFNNGTVGNLTKLSSSNSGAIATINKFDKSSVLSYSNIKDITVTGGHIMYAPNSTDGGNNSGIIFSNPSIISNINGVSYSGALNVNGITKANIKTFVNHR